MDERPTPGTAPLDRGNLAAALLWASDWCNEALLDALEERGWPRFTRSQSLVFARLGAGVDRAADLARDIGITRQSMQAVLAPLFEGQLLEAEPDPGDGRARRLRLGPRGRALVSDVTDVLDSLWDALEDRIGAEDVSRMRTALGEPWGDPPRL